MNTPLVTVIMPVFNTERYLASAVNSILNQTYRNFEFLIFDDASEDDSLEILKSFNDNRVKLITSETNKGYLFHLNQGLQMSKGKYILRMDSDDEAYPHRIEQQVKFMERHPEVGLAGSWYRISGATEKVKKLPVTDKQLKVYLINSNPFGHPTVIYRKSILDKFNLKYEEAYYTSEDYKLWYEMSKVSQIANIPHILVNYHLHTENISTTKKKVQSEIKKNIQIEIVKETFPELTNDERTLFVSFLNKKAISSEDFLVVDRLLQKILIENRYYSRKYLTEYFLHLWLHYVAKNQYDAKKLHFFKATGLVDKLKILKNLYWA